MPEVGHHRVVGALRKRAESGHGQRALIPPPEFIREGYGPIKETPPQRPSLPGTPKFHPFILPAQGTALCPAHTVTQIHGVGCPVAHLGKEIIRPLNSSGLKCGQRQRGSCAGGTWCCREKSAGLTPSRMYLSGKMLGVNLSKSQALSSGAH